MSKFYGIISGLFMRNKFKIEIEKQNTISYECVICFMDVDYIPYKYKCSNENCSQKICDDCFFLYLQNKNDCMFCRSELIITKEIQDEFYKRFPPNKIKKSALINNDIKFIVFFTLLVFCFSMGILSLVMCPTKKKCITLFEFNHTNHTNKSSVYLSEFNV